MQHCTVPFQNKNPSCRYVT